MDDTPWIIESTSLHHYIKTAKGREIAAVIRPIHDLAKNSAELQRTQSFQDAKIVVDAVNERARKDALLRQAMEALTIAHTGLEWYRGVMPEYVDSSDGEADTEINAAIAAIQAELSHSPAPAAPAPTSQWQDIATAPKDGPILAYNPVQGVYATRYDRGEWPHADWYSDDLGRDASLWYPRPTHWQPLPSAPLSASPEAK
jgi:hypothetical protein